MSKPRKISVTTKLASVQKMLQGETAQDVADGLGVDTKYVERWAKTYERAGKAALRFTSDPWDKPSLEDVIRSKQRAFPSLLLRDVESAALFFVAQFYGKNEVIHFYEMGVPDVTLVDIDKDRLDHMEDIYPDHWTCVLEDAFSAAERLKAEGKRYDLVMADPFSPMIRETSFDKFPLFRDISNKYVLFIAAQAVFDELGLDATPESIQAHYNAHIDPDVKVLDLHKRSNHEGGIYWCVLDVTGCKK